MDRISPGRSRRVRDPGLRPRFRRAAAQALLAHQPADALTGALAALVAQLGMDPWRAIPARGSLVLSLGRDEETGVLAVPVRGLPVSAGVACGTGYLQQLARPCWHSSTTWALNSGVNERRRRGFFPMLSMIGHPSGRGSNPLVPHPDNVTARSVLVLGVA